MVLIVNDMFVNTFGVCLLPRFVFVCCFDYFYDHTTEDGWVHWDTQVEAYDHPGMIGDDCQFFDITVNTRDSTRLTYIW